MHRRSETSVSLHVHAGDGKLHVWYAQDGKLRATPSGGAQGILFENNAYLIQYSYQPSEGKAGELKNLVYEWQGRLAMNQDKHFVHTAAKALAEEVKLAHPPAVLVQGKEDDLFLSLFRGKSIVHIGDQFPVRRVTFYAAYPASLSENVYISGSATALGKWELEQAVQLFPAQLENMYDFYRNNLALIIVFRAVLLVSFCLFGVLLPLASSLFLMICILPARLLMLRY